MDCLMPWIYTYKSKEDALSAMENELQKVQDEMNESEPNNPGGPYMLEYSFIEAYKNEKGEEWQWWYTHGEEELWVITMTELVEGEGV